MPERHTTLKKLSFPSISSKSLRHNPLFAGRALLAGNLVRLPLLGVSAYFQVEQVESGGGGGRGGEVAAVSAAVGVVGEITAIKLLPRGGGMADAVGTGARGFANTSTASNRVGGGAEGDDECTSSSGDEQIEEVEGEDPGAAAAKRALRAARRIDGGGGSNDTSDGFDQLGGVGEYAAALRELVELPLRRPDLFESCGVRPPRGVLLWGPPGGVTSKLRVQGLWFGV